MYNAKTTDNQDEVYDVVDDNDVVVGTATRKQVHTDKSLIHRAVVAFIFNSKRQLLLQKRSMTKDTNPGRWALSVGGHVDSGTDYIPAIHREVREELGIDMPLLMGEKFLVVDDTETEFWMTFLGAHDGPFPDFNSVEAEEVRFFDLEYSIQEIDANRLPHVEHLRENVVKAMEYVRSGLIDALLSGSKKEVYV